MKRYLHYALAGLIAPFASYDLARSGSVLLALLAVAAIAAASTAFRIGGQSLPDQLRLWAASLVFSVGALISEGGIFTHYYLTFGYRDEKLNVGFAIMQLEYAIIAAVGSAAICISLIIQRRVMRARQVTSDSAP